jgi:hypothetical protein
VGGGVLAAGPFRRHGLPPPGAEAFEFPLRIKDFAGPVDTPQVPVRAVGDDGLSRDGA